MVNDRSNNRDDQRPCESFNSHRRQRDLNVFRSRRDWMGSLIVCVRSSLHSGHLDAVIVAPKVVSSLHQSQNQMECVNIDRPLVQSRSLVWPEPFSFFSSRPLARNRLTSPVLPVPGVHLSMKTKDRSRYTTRLRRNTSRTFERFGVERGI